MRRTVLPHLDAWDGRQTPEIHVIAPNRHCTSSLPEDASRRFRAWLCLSMNHVSTKKYFVGCSESTSRCFCWHPEPGHPHI